MYSHPALNVYHKPKNWDRQACANSVDPDQMPQNVASDQDLLFCQSLSNIRDTGRGSRRESFRILGQVL